MKAELLSLEKKVVGEVALDDSIFGLEARVDIIKRVIDWQRAKARSGTHSVKTVGEVSWDNKKSRLSKRAQVMQDKVTQEAYSVVAVVLLMGHRLDLMI